MDFLVKRVFGSGSEQLDSNQLELLTLPESSAVEASAPHREAAPPESAQGPGGAFAGEPAGGGGSHRSEPVKAQPQATDEILRVMQRRIFFPSPPIKAFV